MINLLLHIIFIIYNFFKKNVFITDCAFLTILHKTDMENLFLQIHKISVDGSNTNDRNVLVETKNNKTLLTINL